MPATPAGGVATARGISYGAEDGDAEDSEDDEHQERRRGIDAGRPGPAARARCRRSDRLTRDARVDSLGGRLDPRGVAALPEPLRQRVEDMSACVAVQYQLH